MTGPDHTQPLPDGENRPAGQPQPGYGQQPPPPSGQQPPAYGQQMPPAPQGYGIPGAPYGIDHRTGLPYSEKTKLIAGLLQILLPLGIGRFYTGHTGLGIAQLLVTIFTCGIGSLWPFIDGIIILATDSTDAEGRPLRMS